MPPVTFTVGFDEFQAAARAKAALGRFGRAGRYAVWLAIYLLVVIAWILLDYGSEGFRYLSLWPVQKVILIGIACMAAVILAIELFFRHVVYRWLYRRYAIAGQPVTVTFAHDVLKWSGPGFGVSFDWRKIEKVYVDRDHLTLFVSRNEALSIPRRAAGSDAEFDALVRFARERAGD